MTTIIPLTESQANELQGQLFAPDSYFNPTFNNGQWFISIEEQAACEIEWIKQIEPIEIELIYPEI
jgi:hypothetical protein